jgi:indole-3-glycerol phosphate synthase
MRAAVKPHHSILAKIIEQRRRAIDAGKRAEARSVEAGGPPVDTISPAPGRDFAGHIHRPDGQGVRLIAEIKRASPSKGALALNVVPAELASVYEQNGAAAISVLTEDAHFRGCLDDLRVAREAVKLPVLRKDFIIDEWQIGETARHGPADAILLIASLLDVRDLEILQARAAQMGMSALVEVHDQADLDIALEAGARIIGINNRKLDTFEVSLETTRQLRPRIPRGVLVVAESGILTRDDSLAMEDQGVDAILVGEVLMTSDDPAQTMRTLLGIAS